jgi:hypothetical protein
MMAPFLSHTESTQHTSRAFLCGAEKEEEYAQLAGRRIAAAEREGVLREIEEAR